MAYLMLYGVGWTQRWQVADAAVPAVEEAIGRVGRRETGRLEVLDPGTGEPIVLVVAWRHVAAAVVLDSSGAGAAVDPGNGGQYR
jgi:hypothetical protein